MDMTADPSTARDPETQMAVRGPGRPRRYDAEVEVAMILDAGFRVMRRNGYADASMADILEEASISSRAFYRHFPSKDDLLLALLRREAGRVSAQLDDAVSAAAGATDAIYAWLDVSLDVFFEPRRVLRAAIMSSDAARRAEGYGLVIEEIGRKHARPLVRAISDGVATGEITSPDPELDASLILSLCSSMSNTTWSAPMRIDRDLARASILRYVCPAIGLRPRP
jgi:AcrR family transcriptional regulator